MSTLRYNILKFMQLLMPDRLIYTPKGQMVVPLPLVAIIATILPHTPLNILVYSLLLIIIYMFDPFGLSSRTEYYCRFNKPEKKSVKSFWSAVKSSYMFYFIIMIVVNGYTIDNMRKNFMANPSIGFKSIPSIPPMVAPMVAPTR
jgi:hypothetical protein